LQKSCPTYLAWPFCGIQPSSSLRDYTVSGDNSEGRVRLTLNSADGTSRDAGRAEETEQKSTDQSVSLMRL